VPALGTTMATIQPDDGTTPPKAPETERVLHHNRSKRAATIGTNNEGSLSSRFCVDLEALAAAEIGIADGVVGGDQLTKQPLHSTSRVDTALGEDRSVDSVRNLLAVLP